MDAIRVLIADDDPLARRALALFSSQAPHIEVVGEAGDGEEAIAAVESLHPDVVLMDVQMPGMAGPAATAELTARWPSTKVLAITTFGSIDTILPMLHAGAAGYLLKSSGADEIVAAVHHVHGGTGALSPEVASRLIASIREGEVGAPVVGDLEALTDRELEVVRHLAAGMSNGEIARRMLVSEGTVKAHLGRILGKWNARDRVQVLVKAARAGIVDFR